MVGSGWAWSAFDKEDPNPKIKPTINYSDVWGFEYDDRSLPGASNQDCFDTIKNYNKEKLPIIWFWCTPFNVDEVDNETQLNLMSKDWETYYNDMNTNLQKKINSLDHRILIIGSHSDPPKTGWDDHITILDNSIQDFINQKCGTKKIINFPVEIFHQLIVKNSDKEKPDRSLIEKIYLGYKRWLIWEQQEYFFWVHPTTRAVNEFAEFSREKVRLWLSS